MARDMHDTTEIYRASITHLPSWRESPVTHYYGPYEGPTGKGHAKKRLGDQHSGVIEGKVQKLICIHDGNGPDLQWVDVDDSR